jgi:hypothetical protein
MKKVNIDDRDAAFWRSARGINGITAKGEFTSASRDAIFSCVALLLLRKSKHSSRLGILCRLATPFADSDELNMRCSQRLLAEERHSPRSTCASRAAAESVKVAAIANLASA